MAGNRVNPVMVKLNQNIYKHGFKMKRQIFNIKNEKKEEKESYENNSNNKI